MLQTVKMPGVSECTIAQCAYNSNKACHAIAIAIGDGVRPVCDRAFNLPRLGGSKADKAAHRISAYCHNFEYSEAGGREENYGKYITFFAA